MPEPKLYIAPGTRRYLPKGSAFWDGRWRCQCPKCLAKPKGVEAVLVTVTEGEL